MMLNRGVSRGHAETAAFTIRFSKIPPIANAKSFDRLRKLKSIDNSAGWRRTGRLSVREERNRALDQVFHH
jgi:hypothetical protein